MLYASLRAAVDISADDVLAGNLLFQASASPHARVNSRSSSIIFHHLWDGALVISSRLLLAIKPVVRWQLARRQRTNQCQPSEGGGGFDRLFRRSAGYVRRRGGSRGSVDRAVGFIWACGLIGGACSLACTPPAAGEPLVSFLTAGVAPAILCSSNWDSGLDELLISKG